MSAKNEVSRPLFGGVAVANVKAGKSDASRVLGNVYWRHRYSRLLLTIDSLAIFVSIAAAYWTRFGAGEESSTYNLVLAGCIGGGWMTALTIFRTRSVKIVGTDTEEYRRVVSASVSLFAAVAVISFALDLRTSRGYLAWVLPVGVVAILLGRLWGRHWLNRQRRAGRCLTTAVVVGSRSAAQALADVFDRDPGCGYSVAGVCVPLGGGPTRATDGGRPCWRVESLTDEQSVLAVVSATNADIVIVTATENLGDSGIRSLLWAMDSANIGVVVSLGVADVAKRRLTMRPVGNLPLLHVERPTYSGAAKFGKTLFDLTFATIAVVATGPVMVAVALAVKLTSHGPVLYRSERIGLAGRPFQMLKFRTMVDGADRLTAELLAGNDCGNGVLFKMRNDPRVTPLGKMLRKYSIDELPQFFNVLSRQMSVVGPRPPLRREVEQYDDNVGRRLLVKPGITGLWQVSGRSDLSWDETMRLDQSYIENWSMAGDAVIVAKTVRAVCRGNGAY